MIAKSIEQERGGWFFRLCAKGMRFLQDSGCKATDSVPVYIHFFFYRNSFLPFRAAPFPFLLALPREENLARLPEHSETYFVITWVLRDLSCHCSVVQCSSSGFVGVAQRVEHLFTSPHKSLFTDLSLSSNLSRSVCDSPDSSLCPEKRMMISTLTR